MTVVRGLFRILAISFVLMLVSGCSDQETDLESLMAGVVRIVAMDKDGNRSALGTGFVINDRGDVVTVGERLEGVNGLFVQPAGGNADDLLPAEIVWSSPAHDLAVLSVKDLDQPPLIIAEVIPEGGASLFLLGFSGEACCEGTAEPKLQPGAMGRLIRLPRAASGETVDAIMHSATVNNGSEGAPLLDSCGAVIGVASLSLDPSGSPPQGIYFGAAIGPLAQALKERDIPFKTVKDPCRDL